MEHELPCKTCEKIGRECVNCSLDRKLTNERTLCNCEAMPKEKLCMLCEAKIYESPITKKRGCE